MKKLLLILTLISPALHAMDDNDIMSGEDQLQAISNAMPQLETALEKWQLTIEHHPLSAITDKESAQTAIDAINQFREQADDPYKTLQPLALINLLTLQPNSDNPHNPTVLALLSSFNKLKPQLEAQETKFDEYLNLRSFFGTKKSAINVLNNNQKSYEKTVQKLQEHLNQKQSKESFFQTHKNDYSMMTLDEFTLYSKYFTAD